MPPRSNPTIRQRRLGTALRQLREQSGLSATEAANLLGVDRTRISNTEAGRFGISPARVRTLACNYQCSDASLIDALAELAQDHHKGWWEAYRDALPLFFLDIAELEWHATRLQNALTSHMPGLLQTEAHSRAIFSLAIPPLPPGEVDMRVKHRQRRAEVLDREQPPAYEALIHEAALRMQFGGRTTTREQLKYLLTVSERSHVTLRIVPFAAGGFPGAGQTVLYAHGGVPALDTVQLDASYGSVFIDSEARLANYRRLLHRMSEIALDEAASRDFIRQIVHDL